jgi:hypothetical protein
VWNYIRDTGLVDSKCFPAPKEDAEVPNCEEKCEDGEVYKIQHVCATVGEEGIKREIE